MLVITLRSFAAAAIPLVLLASGSMSSAAKSQGELNSVHSSYPLPALPFETEDESEPANDTLEAAIAEAFATNPDLAARRYDLRATDDEVGIAMSQARPQVELQLTGGYELTLPGTITQAARPLADRLNNPNIERNTLTSQLVIDQPIYAGGRISQAVRVAMANSAIGREALRGIEGDLLLELIATYSDVRRDTKALAIRRKNVWVLEATLDEIVARREAGELTRTDIAQAESQLQAARVQFFAAEGQLEASRAAFKAIVGRNAGALAPVPPLPNLPDSADEAFAVAELKSPELAEALATERASRERISAARAEGRPVVSLRGTAGTTGPALPFDRAEHDVIFTGRATLTIPLIQGGRVRSQVAQAENRQSADALRVEANRRQLVQAIVVAWNQWVTASRNAEAQEVQLKAARIYYEGAFEEYREGLRSTFDVLYAQNSLRETEIALLSSKRDLYVAQAVLLRRMGQLEVRQMLVDKPGYDPEAYLGKVKNRGAVPWGGLIRKLDSIAAPGSESQELEVLAVPDNPEMTPPNNVNDAPGELIRGHETAPSGETKN